MSSTYSKYLDRRLKYSPFIPDTPSPELKVVVTIPLFNEPDVIPTLESIYLNAPSERLFEVLPTVNHSDAAPRSVRIRNRSTLAELRKWKEGKRVENLHIIELADVPEKVAGVGHARKAVMDEALIRLCQAGRSDGIIACTDGDTLVGEGYVKKLLDLLEHDDQGSGYSFAFEHRLDGLVEWQLEAIMRYELHLRYFKRCHEVMGHPHGTFTVGSAMACRMKGYAQQGGMNERKAGEDFYFLQKFAKADRLVYDPRIIVYPSARSSDRVPFGTGKAVGDYSVTGKLDTYSFESVLLVREWIRKIRLWHEEQGDLDAIEFEFRPFLEKLRWKDHVRSCASHSTDLDSFLQRFFTWFDAFKVMKALHWLRDEAGYRAGDVLEQINKMRHWAGMPLFKDHHEALSVMREEDVAQI